MLGIIIVFVVGITVSLLTEPPDRKNLDPVLFSPFIRQYVIKKNSKKYGTKEPAEQELMNKAL
jgi:hypothetical protein